MYQCREDKTRFPGFLCPDYAGFLGMTENHFFDALANVLNDPNMDCRYVRVSLHGKKLLGHTQRATKFKKVQAKKLVTSNKSISRKTVSTKIHFLPFQKWPKINF